MATVKDVARLAGVSTATVSRALAAPDKVAEATRVRVERAAAQVGYSPNANARSLRTNESKTIVVIIPDISNLFFTEVIKGVEDIAQKYGYKVLVGDFNHDLTRGQRYLELISSRQADGVLLLSAELPIELILDEEGESRFPIVTACEFYKDSGIPSVRVDNEYSVQAATKSLLEMGHTKIAMITGPMENPLCSDRLRGFERALAQTKIVTPAHYVVSGDFTLASGYKLGGQLLSLDDRPQAIFCHNDEMAIGVLKVAREMQINVPKALSVVGFDNTAFSEYCSPELTTIHQPRRLIGETAMKLLLDILAQRKPNPEMVLPTQYLVRGSTASPQIES
ncbi:LacI family DNA-binding transcriptional regulator [Leucothrix mucor]|uniref:LacI family DNA-binding transcriptional regulator n=1 Tax=Leucothrix mucor TaxID=45248 RepID=UPI0003B2EA57|nr:LacI family DNA-binding transcriptional regulator [Leucothrix mucor]